MVTQRNTQWNVFGCSFLGRRIGPSINDKFSRTDWDTAFSACTCTVMWCKFSQVQASKWEYRVPLCPCSLAGKYCMAHYYQIQRTLESTIHILGTWVNLLCIEPVTSCKVSKYPTSELHLQPLIICSWAISYSTLIIQAIACLLYFVNFRQPLLF